MNRLRLLAWGSVALWIAITALLVPLAGKSGDIVSKDPALLLPRSSEATRALIAEREAFPGSDTPVAVLVYVRGTGITGADRAAVEADRTAFAALSSDGRIDPAAPSADGQALLVSFPLREDGGEPVDAVKKIKKGLEDSPAGLETAVTGSAGALSDGADAVSGTDTTLLLSAALVVAVLLLITYRSPSMWILPLFAVGLAGQAATGIVYLLAEHADVTVTEDATALMMIMLFGVGTDYALLLIARYREELHRHADRFVAMAVAVRRSFPAILASAGTVTVGMLCLLAARMNDVRGFGPIAAAGIVVVFAVMTTLLPALLVLLGRWVFWPFIPRAGEAPAASGGAGVWARAAALVDRRPRRIWVLSVLALVVLSAGALGFRPGQTAEQSYTKEVGSVVGQRLVERHYPGGASGPARIVAPASAAGPVVAAAKADRVSSVGTPRLSADGRTAVIEAVLADPPDSGAAKATIDRLRDGLDGTGALVGGQTATTLDVERASYHDNLVVVPLILVVVLAVLVLLLRAALAPILLAASVILSFGAAMGAAGLLMKLLGHPHFMPSLPLYGFLFLVTLGIDYTIFLMTRAREEVGERGHRQGVLTALTVTGGVITSAGIVLAATFATLITLPVVMALHIGAIVAIGVLLDTLVVRTLLIPALVIDVGERVWWPGRRASRRTEPLTRESVDLVG
ncbi:MMPL family transporter [Actinocorallia longicatena]|uniref:MMPL family transporter n=1 Tax=Actinocorallia longicatena TaxID=111803 RepID=A0ABP6QDE0_9ACTN